MSRHADPILSPSRLALPMLSLACALAGALPAGAAELTQVTVTDIGCVPAALTVPAGKSTFRIKNESRRVVEWEILKGSAVVDERENIAPGFVQSLTATLQAGEYQMTCGLVNNPKGKLTVTAASGESAPPAPPAAAAGPDLSAVVAAYKTYVLAETDSLVAATRKFTDAVKDGNLAGARQYYAPTHVHYERIEPVAELFNDLDKRIDVRADDFEKKDADPEFTGFHRLEKGLFADDTTTDLGPVATKLMADVEELRTRIAGLEIPPAKMVGGAAELIEEVAATKLSGEEDRYSRTDLWDFGANIDGAEKIFALVRPLVEPRDGALAARADANFAKVKALLGKYREGEGFVPYNRVTDQDRTSLKGPITALAEDLSRLRGVPGLD